MGFFKRLLGVCETAQPLDPNSWTYDSGKLTVDLKAISQLDSIGGAVRFEGKSMPDRVLLIRGDDNNFHAFSNKCTHGKRRLDPQTGNSTIQCCSVGKSVFDYSGQRMSGSAKKDLKTYPVSLDGKTVIVDLD